MVRLYFDEDAMSHALVYRLRARGLDVVTPEEAGTRGFADEAQLDWATAQGRVLYTFNIPDFCRIHSNYMRQEREHKGIIVCHQQRYSIGEQMRRILKLAATKSAEEMVNNLEFLSAWGI
jgi:hypothetical protein